MTDQSAQSIESKPWIDGRNTPSEDESRYSEIQSGELTGEGTLKEILRNKGAVAGKKEMIINLDSIEEENGYDEAATHRTQVRRYTSTTKMFELETHMNSLEHKFNKFESKVHNIQAQSKQFEIPHSPTKPSKASNSKVPTILDRL